MKRTSLHGRLYCNIIVSLFYDDQRNTFHVFAGSKAHTESGHIVTTDTYDSMHASNKLPIPANRGRERERKSDVLSYDSDIFNGGARVYMVTIEPFYRGVFFVLLYRPFLLNSFENFAEI